MGGWRHASIYLKHYYKNEAFISDTKIVTSVYSQSLMGHWMEMINKIKLDGIPEEDVPFITNPDYESIMKSTINHSDAVIVASEGVSSSLTKFIESSKPFYLRP
jgi:starch synthase